MNEPPHEAAPKWWHYVVSMLASSVCALRAHRLQDDGDALWCRRCGQVIWRRRQ